MKKRIFSLFSLISAASLALGAPHLFDFKDPKGVNNAVFKLDRVEGGANGISGSVTFDPDKPSATKGKIVVAVASMHVPNPLMKEHMHGSQWMDATKYPEITFETKDLKNVKASGDDITADAEGTLIIKGVSKVITAPVKLSYLKDKLGDRQPNLKGDLLVIRSTFNIKRADFGINPAEKRLADSIELTLSIAGAAAR